MTHVKIAIIYRLIIIAASGSKLGAKINGVIGLKCHQNILGAKKMCNLCAAACYYCMDGENEDCKTYFCPLYKFQPFRDKSVTPKISKREIEDEINFVKSLKSRAGKNKRLAFLRGEYVSDTDRIIARCHVCCGGWEDEIFDCHDSRCPLYEKMPYKGK
jgi:hypothetical protein